MMSVTNVAGDYGATSRNFYTDIRNITEFNHFVTYVLNRKNTLTGLQYKNDPYYGAAVRHMDYDRREYQ